MKKEAMERSANKVRLDDQERQWLGLYPATLVPKSDEWLDGAYVLQAAEGVLESLGSFAEHNQNLLGSGNLAQAAAARSTLARIEVHRKWLIDTIVDLADTSDLESL